MSAICNNCNKQATTLDARIIATAIAGLRTPDGNAYRVSPMTAEWERWEAGPVANELDGSDDGVLPLPGPTFTANVESPYAAADLAAADDDVLLLPTMSYEPAGRRA